MVAMEVSAVRSATERVRCNRSGCLAIAYVDLGSDPDEWLSVLARAEGVEVALDYCPQHREDAFPDAEAHVLRAVAAKST